MSEMPSSELVDRISSLPDSIQCHILSFLRTNEAVKTSFLSRNWHSLWTNVPSFSFCHHDDRSKPYEHFEKFVNLSLFLNNSQPINSFELDCDVADPFYLRAWVSTAIDRNVCKLNVMVRKGQFRVPYKLFTCKTLEHLELASMGVSLNVPSFVFLPRLTELNLYDIIYETDECIPKLLSGCPMLKRLSIRRIFGEDTINTYKICSPVLKYFFLDLDGDAYPHSVEIDAPVLEELLIFASSYENTTIRMKNLTSLNKADIFLFGNLTPTDNRYHSVLKAIEGLSSVKNLSLSGQTMMLLSKATSKLSVKFQRLTKLDVKIACQWSALLDLMRCSDSLEVINLEKEESHSHTHVGSWRNPGEVPNCLVLSLKDVTFKGFQGLQDELALIKYILKHGSALQRLHLHASRDVISRSKSKMLKNRSAFSRKSRQCEIVFRED